MGLIRGRKRFSSLSRVQQLAESTTNGLREWRLTSCAVALTFQLAIDQRAVRTLQREFYHHSCRLLIGAGETIGQIEVTNLVNELIGERWLISDINAGGKLDTELTYQIANDSSDDWTSPMDDS